MTDEHLKIASTFRTKERIPALAYFYPKSNGNIWRSSQTKRGFNNKRNDYDEELLRKITMIGSTKKIIIYDCRPYLSAQANRLKGAGFENIVNYSGSEIIFCQIENIHTARNALNKIYSILNKNKFFENNKFFFNL